MSAREKRRLKNEARDELLPKAFLKSDRVHGYVDPGQKIIGIDSGQEANAERFLRRLTAAIDGLNIQPLRFRFFLVYINARNWTYFCRTSRNLFR